MFIFVLKKKYNLKQFCFFNYGKDNQKEIKFSLWQIHNVYSITLEIIKLNDDEKRYIINIRIFNKCFALKICL